MSICDLQSEYSIVLGDKIVARNYVSISPAGNEIKLNSKTELFGERQLGMQSDRRSTELLFGRTGGLLSCKISSERFGSHAISFVERLIDDAPMAEDYDWIIENNGLGILECGIRIMLEKGAHSWRLLNLEDGTAFDLQITGPDQQGVVGTNLGLSFDSRNNFTVVSESPLLKIVKRAGVLPSWTPRQPIASPQQALNQDGQILEEEVFLEGESLSVAGTFSRPRDGSFSCVAVLVGGSGIHDRDGNTATRRIGYDNWARELAMIGIASVRFDRYPANDESVASRLSFSDAVAQIKLALDFAHGQSRGKPIIVLGHSLGALLGAAACKTRADVKICFFLAGTAEPLRSVIRGQAMAAAESLTSDPHQQSLMVSQTEEFLRAVDEGCAPEQERMTRLSMEVLDLHIEEFLSTRQRYAVIHGEADVQAPVENAFALKASIEKKGAACSLRTLPGCDHIFVSVTSQADDGDPPPAAITEAAQLIARAVLAEIDSDSGADKHRY
jgi:pimeloyl-ACP methyl ester carboxylesterase